MRRALRVAPSKDLISAAAVKHTALDYDVFRADRSRLHAGVAAACSPSSRATSGAISILALGYRRFSASESQPAAAYDDRIVNDPISRSVEEGRFAF